VAQKIFNSDAESTPSQRVITAAAAVIVISGLKYAQALLVPVLLGIMIAAASSQLVTRLLRRNVPPLAVAIVVLVLDIGALTLLAGLLIVAAGDLHTLLPIYVAKVSSANDVVRAYLQSHGLAGADASTGVSLDLLPAAVSKVADQCASLLSYGTVVVLVAFFTLCEVTQLGDKLRSLTDRAEQQFSRVNRIAHEIQRYLAVKTLTSLVAALAAFIVLKAMGIQLALLLALALFLLHFIPNVGAMIAAVPAVIAAFADRGLGSAAVVAGAYILIATAVGSVLEPKLLGRTLGFSPLVVLLGMLFWGWLWGPLGALLSVPLMVVAKIVLENIPDLAWIARLVENAPDLSPARERASIPMLRRPSYIIGLGKNPNA